MNIKALLEKLDKEVISEETATAIAEAFETAVNEKVESRIKLEVENASAKIDEDHANKLEKLLEAIDSDHTSKLETVVSAINENHTEKLENITNYFRRALNEKADEFSNRLIDEVSNFLDITLEKLIPDTQLTEAVENTYARKKLAAIRNLIGIDPEHINESIKSTLVDGKKTVDDLNERLNESYKDNDYLLGKIKTIESKILLDEKTNGMPSMKKEFIFKLLNDKDSSYIQENFNYVVEMFERSEEEAATELVSEAKQNAKSIDAKVPTKSIVTESKQNAFDNDSNLVSGYLNELKRK
jgi:hypothetical protein